MSMKRAEMKGFEPLRRLPDLPHFECGPFSHLGTSPDSDADGLLVRIYAIILNIFRFVIRFFH